MRGCPPFSSLGWSGYIDCTPTRALRLIYIRMCHGVGVKVGWIKEYRGAYIHDVALLH